MFRKKIFTFVLVFLLVFVPVNRCYAAAETGIVTVVGGAIGGAGIGATLAAVAPVALVIAGLALAATGAYIVLTDDSIEAGKSNLDFIGEKISEYCTLAGKTFEDFCNTIVDGATVLADGAIAITNDASNLISQWISSLVEQEEIVDVITFTQKTCVINGVTCPVIGPGESVICGHLNNGKTLRYDNTGRTNVAVLLMNNYTYVFLSDSRNIKVQAYQDNDSSGGIDGSAFRVKNFYYNYYAGWSNYIVDNYIPLVPNFPDCLNNLSGFDIISGRIGQDSIVSENPSNVDAGVFNPSAGNVNVINPGLDLTNIGASGLVGIRDYLDTLQRALDGIENNTIAISDSVTGLIDVVDVPTYVPVDNATVDEEDEAAVITGATPIINVDENPSGTAAENALKGLQFDLTRVFPFCLPFDLARLLAKLDVPPVTPQLSISIPLFGSETLDLDLDLSDFDFLASILRKMEVFAFVIGLAVVTRNLIRG